MLHDSAVNQRVVDSNLLLRFEIRIGSEPKEGFIVRFLLNIEIPMRKWHSPYPVLLLLGLA
jgi:hypothetical protein